MDALKEQWIEECGYTPVGNVEGSEWASGSKDTKVSERERRQLSGGSARCIYAITLGIYFHLEADRVARLVCTCCQPPYCTVRRCVFVWQSAMSAAQKEAYEENKLKMRKAIADPALVDETEQVRQDSPGSPKMWAIKSYFVYK